MNSRDTEHNDYDHGGNRSPQTAHKTKYWYDDFRIFVFIRIVAAVTPVLTMEHAWWGTLTKDTAVSVHLVLLEKTARKVNFKIFI